MEIEYISGDHRIQQNYTLLLSFHKFKKSYISPQINMSIGEIPVKEILSLYSPSGQF